MERPRVENCVQDGEQGGDVSDVLPASLTMAQALARQGSEASFRLDAARAFRAEGSAAFREGRYADARQKYSQAAR